MSMHLFRELERLKKQILALSAVVEENVHRAMAAVEQRDEELANRVMKVDRQIDATEIDVEEECLKIIALHQPVAIDLRLVVSCLKINNDLERIGDLAVRISKRAILLAEHRQVAIPPELPTMAAKAQAMLKNALDALVSLDADLARKVLPADDEVDELNRQIGDRVAAEVQSHPDRVRGLLHVFSVARSLERIGDHATNIAEDVIYMLDGEIVRHRSGPAATLSGPRA